jgi:hypothetical protein
MSEILSFLGGLGGPANQQGDGHSLGILEEFGPSTRALGVHATSLVADGEPLEPTFGCGFSTSTLW